MQAADPSNCMGDTHPQAAILSTSTTTVVMPQLTHTGTTRPGPVTSQTGFEHLLSGEKKRKKDGGWVGLILSWRN